MKPRSFDEHDQLVVTNGKLNFVSQIFSQSNETEAMFTSCVWSYIGSTSKRENIILLKNLFPAKLSLPLWLFTPTGRSNRGVNAALFLQPTPVIRTTRERKGDDAFSWTSGDDPKRKQSVSRRTVFAWIHSVKQLLQFRDPCVWIYIYIIEIVV